MPVLKGEVYIMKKANKEIREKLERYRIRQCEVADQLGITECTLCRWLRQELKPDRKAKVEAAINEIVRKIHEESAL
jgi:transcriptional regulator with XRE-family HTH domain